MRKRPFSRSLLCDYLAQIHHQKIGCQSQHFRIILSAASSLLSRADCSSQRNFESGSLGRKPGRIPVQSCQPKLSMEEPSAFFGQEGPLFDSFFGKTFTQRGKTNVIRAGYNVAVWERFGVTTLHSSIALQTNISMREAREFNFSNVQNILNPFVGSPATFAAERNLFAPRSKLRVAPKRVLENSKVPAAPSCRKSGRQKRACSPTQSCV